MEGPPTFTLIYSPSSFTLYLPPPPVHFFTQLLYKKISEVKTLQDLDSFYCSQLGSHPPSSPPRLVANFTFSRGPLRLLVGNGGVRLAVVSLALRLVHAEPGHVDGDSLGSGKGTDLSLHSITQKDVRKVR